MRRKHLGFPLGRLARAKRCRLACAVFPALLAASLETAFKQAVAQQSLEPLNPPGYPSPAQVGPSPSSHFVRLGPPRPSPSAEQAIATTTGARNDPGSAPGVNSETIPGTLSQTGRSTPSQSLSRYSQLAPEHFEQGTYNTDNHVPLGILSNQPGADRALSPGVPSNPVGLPPPQTSAQRQPPNDGGVMPLVDEPNRASRPWSWGQIRQAQPWSAEQLTSTVPRLAQAALREQIQRRVEKANHLAVHGALFSARREFELALQIAVESRDEARGNDAGKKALAAAMTALEEVDDFARANGITLHRHGLDVRNVVLTHRTPILKEFGGPLTVTQAIQAYLAYAQQQLATATGQDPIVADALYGLGRVYYTLALQSTGPEQLNVPKAVVLYRTAVTVDPAHPLAANELAVLLARYGQWQDAKQVLQAVPMENRSAEMWHNLATIHRRLGEHHWAQEAQAHCDAIRRRQTDSVLRLERDGNIEWLDVSHWADAGSRGPETIRHAGTHATDSRSAIRR